MANNGASNDRLCSGKDEMDCAETTMVEIKIKTLDSQTYTMRVDKCVPVPALKEQIASVTGVLSEQQRLICRGKVLKDDQLLSAYHVEDGHTLHLVVRQPIAPSSEGTPNPDRDPTTTSGRVQGSGGPTVLVSSFNISEQDGELSTSRFLSALLGSLGMANFGSGPEGVDLNETPSERISNATGQRNISRQPPEVSVSGQPFISSGAFSFPAVDPMESLQAPVIPDSLTTLTQNLSRLRQEFVANVEAQSSSIHQGAGFQGTAGQNIDASSFSAPQRGGLPTPASLADVLLTTRQLLNEHVAESLSLLARQLQGHANITDASERARIQNNTLRSGALIHNLGALLLELARTTITMRMGQTPADGIVNAGPAVFISPTGPNPIMVQPLSFQPGIGFGSTGGTVQHNLGISPGSSRTIDIRIRRVLPTDANRRDSNRSRNTGQTDPAGPNNAASSAQAGARDPRVPSSAAAPEPSSRGSVGILFPVLARVQRFNTRTVAAQASDQPPHASPPSVDGGRGQSVPASPAVEFQNLGTFRVDGSGGLVNEQVEDGLGSGLPSQLLSRIEQWLRVVLPSEHHNAEVGTTPPPQTRGTQAQPVSGRDGSAQHENSGTVSEEGVFLSSILQHLMPLISESGGSGSGSDNSLADARDSTTRDQGNGGDRGSSSHRPEDGDASLMEEPEAKRQKRE
ncbi:OLC1v1027965C2 [Oldenlandia corymbosa var. corymbosa]|uniref:OLC1v1027965C2 n=1 Tax=Oldenlandia corymbosa var. corymbosa TaxID=529605 RepID=A0AAV1CAM4_OLDCO|nr:OLC1v1027965C2 [Oldenlandia corymbosa var. corymbosa]